MDILISELSQLPATNQVVDGMCECLPIYERVVLPFETKRYTSALAMLAGFGPVWCCRGCSWPFHIVSSSTDCTAGHAARPSSSSRDAPTNNTHDDHRCLLLRSTVVPYDGNKILCHGARLGWGVRFIELHGDWVLEWMRWAGGSRKWFLSSTWW